MHRTWAIDGDMPRHDALRSIDAWARLEWRDWLINVKWEALSLPQMLSIMPDGTNKMKEFPQDWSAADVSCFIHRRPDRFPFSSMWGCLFNEVAGKLTKAQKYKAMELMVSGAYIAEAKHLRLKTRVEHHPSHVFASLLQKNV